jgi:flagellar basal body-associated protein FliL
MPLRGNSEKVTTPKLRQRKVIMIIVAIIIAAAIFAVFFFVGENNKLQGKNLPPNCYSLNGEIICPNSNSVKTGSFFPLS